VEARRKFEDRLIALGRAHSLLSDGSWEGAEMHGIIQSVMEPYLGEPDRIEMNGPTVMLGSAQALMISMMLHELATNAAKYGALSSATGKVQIEWKQVQEMLWLTWRETGGPIVYPPTRTGFGSRLIQNGLATHRGKVELRFHETGVVCTMACSPA
jgi:two-component sensor histidine kinase